MKKKAKDKRFGVHKVNKNVPNVKKETVRNRKNINSKVQSKNISSKKKLKAKKEKFNVKEFISKYKKKILLLLLVILILIILAVAFYRIISLYRNNNIFAQNAEKIGQDIENPIFKIEKILIYSDANVEDLSETQNLADINISQYTDFAIYINNTETIKTLTEENTVNGLYIDEITVSGTDFGNQKVYYKDVNDICKYRKIVTGTNRIDFNILHTNEEKEQNEEPNVFYTDCSEPIIFSYVNENIIENEDLSTSNEILSLDGSILKYLGIDLENLNYKISFNINIENNLGEMYKCSCSLNINLDSTEGGIYTGYIMQIYDLSADNFEFRKIQ